MFSIQMIYCHRFTKLLRKTRNVIYCTSKFSSDAPPNSYRFVQFRNDHGKPQKLGVIDWNMNEIIDLNVDAKIPNTLLDYIYHEDHLQPIVDRIVREKKCTYAANDVALLAPLTKPDKVICVGLNYKGHCDEQNKPYPEQPFFFAKFPSTIIGHDAQILHPKNTKALDWEVELAVVIGKKAKNVTLDDAMKHIFGYTIAQDISARDWQTPKRNNGQWLIAKSMDMFCPLGPVVVTSNVIPDPHSLSISCSINGVEKQNGNTNELIHRIDKIVSYLSDMFTLLPGDVILTGTPSGVGVFRNPKEFLKPGDVITSEISSIGKLEVQVV